jgi:hypothetical protein
MEFQNPLVAGHRSEDARKNFKEYVTSSAFIEHALAKYGSFTDVDFSKYDLDKPLPGS